MVLLSWLIFQRVGTESIATQVTDDPLLNHITIVGLGENLSLGVNTCVCVRVRMCVCVCVCVCNLNACCVE